MANPTAVTDRLAPATSLDTEFHRGLGLYDSTMVVVGSMIGSGIFIVSADMARLLGVFRRDDYKTRVKYRNAFVIALTVIPVIMYFAFESPVMARAITCQVVRVSGRRIEKRPRPVLSVRTAGCQSAVKRKSERTSPSASANASASGRIAAGAAAGVAVRVGVGAGVAPAKPGTASRRAIANTETAALPPVCTPCGRRR